MALAGTLELGRLGTLSAGIILFLIILIVGDRHQCLHRLHGAGADGRMLVQYPKRQVGNRMFGGETSHLPLKLNTAGVIPPIFASSSLLLMPVTVAQFSPGQGPEFLQTIVAMLGRGQPLYLALYIARHHLLLLLLYLGCVQSERHGGEPEEATAASCHGIRPGQRTAEVSGLHPDPPDHRDRCGLYLTAVCLLPEMLISQWGVPFYFGGTSRC